MIKKRELVLVLIKRFKEERGAAQIIEASIILPIVFIVIFLMVFYSVTFMQQAMLQYHATRLSDYLAKSVMYPGYENIERMYFMDYDTFNVDVNSAMKNIDPYRYLFGLFGSGYAEGRDAVKNARDNYSDFLKTATVLRPSAGTYAFSDADFKTGDILTKNGYTVAIHASTSSITVYLGQPYIFSAMYKMIGLSNDSRKMVISGKSTTFINDAVEFIRTVDTGFDLTKELLDATGISDKITSILDKIKG